MTVLGGKYATDLSVRWELGKIMEMEMSVVVEQDPVILMLLERVRLPTLARTMEMEILMESVLRSYLMTVTNSGVTREKWFGLRLCYAHRNLLESQKKARTMEMEILMESV